MGEYLNRWVNGWRASKRKSGFYLFDADYPFYDGPKGKHFVLYTSLKDYIQSDEFGTEFSSSYTKCLSHLAKRVACLQLVPYHSVSFKSDTLIRGQDILVSTQAVRNIAEQELTAKAKRGRGVSVYHAT